MDDLAAAPNPRGNPIEAYDAFMSMPQSEWTGLVGSLLRGGVLTPAEQEGFERAVVDRGKLAPTYEAEPTVATSGAVPTEAFGGPVASGRCDECGAIEFADPARPNQQHAETCSVNAVEVSYPPTQNLEVEVLRATTETDPAVLHAMIERLRLVVSALTKLVYEDNDPDLPLAEISNLWGNGTPEEMAALEAWEATL